MSQFVPFAPVPVGAPKPLQVGGVLSYSNNTRPSAYANAKVYPTYGFKQYQSAPPFLGERSGHYSVVVQQPDDKRMGAPGLNDVFTPADPEMMELTDYFLKRLPAEQKSVRAVHTIKQSGVQDLLATYLRKKLQDDAEEVRARYAGATQVEMDLASAKLQNRYADMIRHYGSDQRLREALLREYTGNNVEPALRESIRAGLQREMAEGGAGTFPIDPQASAVAMPAMGGEASANLTEATDQQETDMEERAEDIQAKQADKYSDEDRKNLGEDLLDAIEEIKNQEIELQRLYESKDLATTAAEIRQLNKDIEITEDDIVSLREQEKRLREELGPSWGYPKDSANMTPGNMVVFPDEDDEAEYEPFKSDPADAPGAVDDTVYDSIPTVGSAGGAMPELLKAYHPGGSTSRPLVGEIIGHQASAPPASSQSSLAPGSSQSYRQETMRRKVRTDERDARKKAIYRRVMGMDMGGTVEEEEEEEPISTHIQEVGGTDRRRKGGRRRGGES